MTVTSKLATGGESFLRVAHSIQIALDAARRLVSNTLDYGRFTVLTDCKRTGMTDTNLKL